MQAQLAAVGIDALVRGYGLEQVERDVRAATDL